MRRAGWTFCLSAALACAGCHSSASTSDDDGGGAGDLDVNIPPAVFDAAVCVEDAGLFTCLGTQWAACLATVETNASCDDTVPTCVGCFDDAAFDCVCLATSQLASDGGSMFAWSCLGTQYSCSGVQNRDAAPFFVPGDSSPGNFSDASVGESADAEDASAD
jgi:hypothetical protein